MIRLTAMIQPKQMEFCQLAIPSVAVSGPVDSLTGIA